MSWLFSYFTGGNGTEQEENSIREPTDADRLRSQQIEGLRVAVPGVREVQRDQRYRIDTAVKGEPLCLDIILPPQFPLTAPEIKTSRLLQHPWVRGQTVCECPSLKSYSVHSNLGEVVSEIIQELNSSNTILLPSPSHTPSSSPSSHTPSSEVAMSSPHSQPVLPSFHQRPPAGSYLPYRFAPVPEPTLPSKSPKTSPRPTRLAPPPPRAARGYTPPPVPVDFPDLNTMSKEELERFLDDKDGPVLVENFVRTLDAVKKVQEDRDVLFQENEDQAHINLGHEPELQNGWTRLQEKSFELMAEKEKYDKLLRDQRTIRDKFVNLSKTASSRLKTLAQEADTESEIIAEDFIEGKMHAVEFIRNFKEKRKLHHLRMSKHEKLQHSSRRH
jgi:ESCRT-I complex subunit VPS37